MILLWNQCTDGVKINSMIDLVEATRIQLRPLLQNISKTKNRS